MAKHIFKENACPFAYELPYWAIEDGVLVHVDGSCTKGIVFSGLDTWCLSDGRLNELSQALKGLLTSLHQGIYFQICLLADEDIKPEASQFYQQLDIQSDLQNLIFHDRKQVLESSLGRRFRLHLFLTKRISLSKSSRLQRILGTFRWMFTKGEQPTLDLKVKRQEIIHELEKLYNDIGSHFAQYNFSVSMRPMQKEEYSKLLFEILNPRKHQICRQENENTQTHC